MLNMLDVLQTLEFMPDADSRFFDLHVGTHMIRVELSDSEADISVNNWNGVNLWTMKLANASAGILRDAIKLAIHDAEMR